MSSVPDEQPPDSTPAAYFPMGRRHSNIDSGPNFQMGERHINLDFSFFEGIQAASRDLVAVSYDNSSNLIVALDGSFRAGPPPTRPLQSTMGQWALPLVEWATRSGALAAASREASRVATREHETYPYMTPQEYKAWRLTRRVEELAGLMRTREEVLQDDIFERRWLRTSVHALYLAVYKYIYLDALAGFPYPLMSTMSTADRCALPFHPDPGQPQAVAAGEKIYLISRRDCQKAGAYVSWPSASAELNRYATASVKTYYLWSQAESAWWAACDRGEHAHHAAETLARPRTAPSSDKKTGRKLTEVSSPGTSHRHGSPSTARSPKSKEAVPVFDIPSRSPSPQPSKKKPAPFSRSKSAAPAVQAPAPTSRSKSAATSRSKPAAAAAPALLVGRRVYAVRCRDGLGGAVFSSFSEARDWYHAKHAAGLVPALLTADSLTAGVNLLEEFLDVDPRMGERASLVEEEARARRKKVKADMERAKHRREVLEMLQDARDSSEPHSSDESDVSRSTASLESELDARIAHGDEWRYYRTDGGHGKE
ncbi:hypothetical protein B0H11DRAFT_2265219 [Mycena galericulata]|nr:hypothetical protein B0H11DRAFT_2265219 [Mycena galericulata]